jgi:formylglycine-generating enzyme required for sulfatase activity
VSNTNNSFNRIGGISGAGNCNIQIKNSILWNNSTNQYGSFSSGPGGNATFTFSYSIVQGGTTATVGGNTKTLVNTGAGCLTSNPVFAETTNYSLGTSSPAINTGDPVAAKDADGSRADMGWDAAAAAKGSSDADSDSDGVTDYRETQDGTNPFDPKSFDPLNMGLVAYYPFNGNAKDESGNGLDGSTVNDALGFRTLQSPNGSANGSINTVAPTIDSSGSPNSAFKFSGQQQSANVSQGSWISVPNSGITVSKIKKWTISCLIKLEEPIDNYQGARIVTTQGDDYSGVQGFYLAYHLNSGFLTGSNENAGGPEAVASGQTLQPNRYYHVVGTYDGAKAEIWVDGNKMASKVVNYNLTSQKDISIGRHIRGAISNTPGWGNAILGDLDNLRIYNRALSDAEVTQLYAKESSQTNMVLVQGGTLPAGSALGGQTISAFQIARFETTWAEWKEVRTWAAANGYTDLVSVGEGSADNHPVRNVSWYDVVKWCNAKSQREGLTPVYRVSGAIYKSGQSSPVVDPVANGFRLPDEPEWEWVARGGINSFNSPFSGGVSLGLLGWFRDNSQNSSVSIRDGKGTWPVGLKSPNELGIYDMSGNVWEWCWNLSGTDRRIRGGSWDSYEAACEVRSRLFALPSGRNSEHGFRLARTTTASFSFSYTGASQAWVVPANVTQITFNLKGAAGGTASGGGWTVYGGLGASVTGTLKVTPGETLYFFIGGSGDDCQNKTTVNGGFNGGGSGANNSGSGGGGATDIRMGGLALSNRVVVAGGGGGANTSGGFGGGGGNVGPFNSLTTGFGSSGPRGGGGGGYFGGDISSLNGRGGSNFANSSKTLGVVNTDGVDGANGTKSHGSATISYQLN